jgi:hypothetical protein
MNNGDVIAHVTIAEVFAGRKGRHSKLFYRVATGQPLRSVRLYDLAQIVGVPLVSGLLVELPERVLPDDDLGVLSEDPVFEEEDS